MPDRWGRITADDWGAATGMINQIQAMGQRNTAFNNRQKDREEAKQQQADVNTNYQALNAGPQPKPYGDGNIYDAPGELQPVAMVGSPESRVKAKGLYHDDLQYDKGIKGLKIDKEIDEKESQLWQKFASLNGDDQRNKFIDSYVPQSKADYLAFISFGSKLETNDQFKNARIKRNADEGTRRFKIWNNNLRAGKDFLEQGDKQMAEKYIEFAINTAHHPLFLTKNKNGTYDLIFEEAGEKRMIGDDITLEQAYAEAWKIPAKQFVGDFVGQADYIAKRNKAAGFTTWKNGEKEYDVTTIYSKSNPEAGTDVVYEKGGGIATKEDGSPMTSDYLKSKGFRPQKLDDEYKKQQIETSKAAMRSHDRANKDGSAKQMAATNKALTEQITEAAKFFGTDKEPLFDEQGELTQAGDNTRILAMKFYEEHKGNPDMLKGAEYRKFHIAKALVGAVDKKFGVTAKKPGPDTPPVDGARKAKDGFWYVQQGDGWSRVHTGKDGHSPQRIAAEVSGIHGERTAMGGPGEDLPVEPPQPQVEANSPAIRPELPQDISTWNVKIIPQNGRQIPVVMTERGPIPLTPEEIELYKQFSSQQRNQAIGAGVDWFKKNATGTQQLPQ